MKRNLMALLTLVWLPCLAMAQSNDDLYYVPKKETKVQKSAQASSLQRQSTTAGSRSSQAVSAVTAPTVVVRDASGRERDIDEYNRRYTSRENTFALQNDTLYIQEKPYNERGEWVNGFEGTQTDYEYAMRIVRFRSPRYAIPISSPLYWDVVYGGAAFPSWEWNVFDDGLYAYVFPTSSNPLWWDWRFNWSVAGPRWSFGWHAPWYCAWHSPYHYGGYWGSYWGGHWGGYWGGWYGYHPHYAPAPHHPAHGRPYYSYNTRRENGGSLVGGHSIRSVSTTRPSSGNASHGTIVNRSRDNNGRSGGRIVAADQSNDRSVRRSGTATRSSGTYTRSSQIGTGESSYNRPSSTRANSYRNSGAYQRMQNGGSTRSYGTSGAGSRSNSEAVSRGSNSFGSSRSVGNSGSSFGSSRSSGSSYSTPSRSVGNSHSTGGGSGARRR